MTIELRHYTASDLETIEGTLRSVYGEVHAADGVFHSTDRFARVPWRGTGLAVRLHKSLLSDRAEERVTLLVDPAHVKVKALYESWGYRDVGPQQPFPDSPRYATMVKPLPVRA